MNENVDRGKSLLKNTLIISIGTLCTKLLTFFLLPLYTGVLSTEEYGVVDLFTTIISLVVPIISLQIEQGLFRFLIDNRDDERKKKELISTSIVFVIINSFLFLLLFICLSPFIHNEYKYFLATNVVACLFSSIFLQIARGLGNNKEYSIAGVITALFTILCNILFLVALHLKVDGMLLGTLIGYIFGIIYLFFKLKILNYFSFYCCTKKSFKELMKYSLPLVPNSLSWWIFNTSDRVIVSLLLGLAANGVLSVSYKFSSAFIILYNIFNTSWTESIVLHINDDDVENYFNKTFNIIFNFFASIGLCIIAFMPFLFGILINESFIESYNLIPIPILATICQVVVGLISVVYIAKNDTKSIANTAILSAVVNIVVHLGLIKFIGLYAAVISTFASYFVFAIYRSYDVSKRYIKVKYDYKKLFFTLFITTIILICYYLNTLQSKIFMMVVAVLYFIIINGSAFKTLKNIVLKKFKKVM